MQNSKIWLPFKIPHMPCLPDISTMFFCSHRDLDGYYCKGQASNFADKTEYIKKLNALMLSKDFRERIRALEQLVSDCEQNPDMVIVNLFPVINSRLLRAVVFITVLCCCHYLVMEFHKLYPLSSLHRYLMPSKPGSRNPTAKSISVPYNAYGRSLHP